MVVPCTDIFQFAIDCEWSNLQTMIVELGIASVIGYTIARKFRNTITEEIVKRLQKKEKTRDVQLLKESLISFNKIWELIEGLQHWAKQKDLFITQHQDLMKKKNDLVDSTKKQIEDPMAVLDKKLKEKMIIALQKSRYTPATEAINSSTVMIRQKKMLENGWSRDSPDFNVNKRLVDNGTDESLKALTEVISEIKSLI